MSELKQITLNGKPYKVTPESIGALSKSGGNMAGAIKLSASETETTDIVFNRPANYEYQANVDLNQNRLRVYRYGSANEYKEVANIDLSEGVLWAQYMRPTNPIEVIHGGTGAKTAAGARANLGITPRIYVASGEILTSQDGGTTRGSGRATVHITADGVARIDYAVKLTVGGSVSGVFGVGIDSALLKSLNANIPTITPRAGGVCAYYNTDGTVRHAMMGYGGSHTPSHTGWALGRIHTAAGAYGSWSDNNFADHVGLVIVGTCYGIAAL